MYTTTLERNDFLQGFVIDVLLRCVLGTLIHFSEQIKPTVRLIQVQDWPLYNYPHSTTSIVSSPKLFGIVGAEYFVCILLIELRTLYKQWRLRRQPLTDYAVREDLERATATDPIKNELIISRYNNSAIFDFCVRQLRLFLTFTLTILLCELFTNFMKPIVGRLRPDFLSRCKPVGFDPLAPDYTILSSNPVCTEPSTQKIWDGRKSFPSGHSSLSFCSGTYLALLFYFGTRETQSDFFNGLKLVVAAGFVYPAAYISATRFVDYRHHCEDILTGILIGIFFAIIPFVTQYSTGSRLYKKKVPFENVAPLCLKNNFHTKERNEMNITGKQ